MQNSIISVDLPHMRDAGPQTVKAEAAATPSPSKRPHPNMTNPMFNQHGQSNARQWYPWSEAGRISDKCTSELAKQARELYDAWQKRIVWRDKLLSESREIEKKAQAFPTQIDDAIAHEIDSEGDLSSLASMAQDYKAVIEEADPQIWRKAVSAANQAIEAAKGELEGFLDGNWTELVEDHRADAERVAAAWRKAEAAARKTLAPLEREHDELVQSLAYIVGRTEPFTRESLHGGVYVENNGYGKSPVPPVTEIEKAA